MELHEAKSARFASDLVAHKNDVTEGAPFAEVHLQHIVRSLPREASQEDFALDVGSCFQQKGQQLWTKQA